MQPHEEQRFLQLDIPEAERDLARSIVEDYIQRIQALRGLDLSGETLESVQLEPRS